MYGGQFVTDDRLYEWSAVLAAQLLNLHLNDQPKAQQYQAVLFLVFDAVRLIHAETMDQFNRPSNN